ncbi:MAG: thiol reductant ABC exporter subunit CydD [Betaproteobacteria bacterium]|nr:thiol reductant ABC exporter subunit CydD [Betaproteobacteria bacterium]
MTPSEAWLLRQQTAVRATLNRAIALGMANGIMLIAQAWLLAQAINAVALMHQPLHAALPDLLPMPILFLVRFGLVQAQERAAFAAAARVQGELREQLFRRLQALGPLWLAGRASGDLANRLGAGIDALEGYYARWLPHRALSALIPLAILVAVFPADWISGLVLVFTAPLIPLFMMLIGKSAEELNQRQWRVLARMSARFLDTLQGLTTLKLFNASRRETQVVAQISETYRLSTMKVLRVAFLSSVVLEFLSTVSIAVVAVLIGFRLLWHDLPFLPGFFVLFLAPEYYFPLRSLGAHYHARMEAIGAAEGLLEVFEAPLAEAPPPVSTSPLPPAPYRIEFLEVGFSYGPDRQALSGASFALEAGQVTAVVGPSGAGKSTLVNLLLGFGSPSSGRILVNGIDLSRFEPASWLAQIAWIPQRPHLFAGSVLDNVRMARHEASLDEIEAATRAARAHDFICNLPQGLDTVVGERGFGLSGGQIQRLAIARAFLKRAPLVILDEPTAHLDGATQSQVLAAIRELAHGRTLLMITHRVATLSLAQTAVVLEGGRVSEIGTPARLMAADGALARLAAVHPAPVAP